MYLMTLYYLSAIRQDLDIPGKNDANQRLRDRCECVCAYVFYLE